VAVGSKAHPDRLSVAVVAALPSLYQNQRKRNKMTQRERIMVIADSGAGKTHAALSVADELLMEKPDAKIMVIDMDDSLEDLLPKFPDVAPHLNRKPGPDRNWFLVSTYEELLACVDKAKTRLGTGDILIIEGLERGWELAQDYYSQEVYGHSPAEHTTSIRKMNVEGANSLDAGSALKASTFDVARDWPSIKKFWKSEILIPLTTATMYHIVATAASKPLVNLNESKGIWNADPYIRAIFQPVGVIPEGEKNDIKRFSTIVVLGILGSNHIFGVVKLRSLGAKILEQRWTNRPFLTSLRMAVTPPELEKEKEVEEKSVATA
jgi:hypothetical protein